MNRAERGSAVNDAPTRSGDEGQLIVDEHDHVAHGQLRARRQTLHVGGGLRALASVGLVVIGSGAGGQM